MNSNHSGHGKSRLVRAGVGFGLGFVLLIVLFYWGVDPKVFHREVESWNGWLVFLLMAVLPLIGFPASIIFVVAGAKFGSGWGLVVVSGSIAINLLASYWICSSLLRGFVEAVFRRTKYRMPQVPEGEHVSVTLLTALLPGIPYTGKNYGLVLAGVPFRPYFWTSLPAHMFHASLALFFGHFTEEMTAGKIIFLIVYGLVLAALSRRVIRRLRARRAATSS
jgi:uncharacterized membrane protein YdjX (TVP38/TMEM64 family)